MYAVKHKTHLETQMMFMKMLARVRDLLNYFDQSYVF